MLHDLNFLFYRLKLKLCRLKFVFVRLKFEFITVILVSDTARNLSKSTQYVHQSCATLMHVLG